MEFEFDETKHLSNKKKHGIGFVEIQSLWEDTGRLEIPARTEDEPRLLVIGKVGQKLWTAITTNRGPKIRIISARRSRKEEVVLYESYGV